jgi:transcriptional regulator GlxA family with amidase domain
MSSVQSLLDRVRLTEKQKLDELCQWLLDHLHECIGWSVLVQRSKMSNEELHRVFMQHHHMSPMQWISQQRGRLVRANVSNKVVQLESRRQHG